MSAWSQQQQQPQQQQNGIFPGMLDNSSAQAMFDPSAMTNMYNGGTINPSHFNNPHMQQRMSNGSPGSVHPQNAFGNQGFNVGQVVPTKRSSDGMAMSPPTQNAALNTSRSHTPMQGATSFQPGQQGQQYPNPYQHLQQQGNSANASPSPTIQNQQFRPPQPPPRMTTQSPAGFNPMQPNTPQMSPGPAQQHAISMSPSAQQQSFSPGLTGGAGFGQQFNNPAMMSQGMHGAMNNMNMAGMNMTAQAQAQLQQKQYQQRLIQQQQAQRMQANMMNQRQMSGQMAGMPGQQGQQMSAQSMGMQNGQQLAPHQMSQQPGRSAQQLQQPQQAGQEKARQWLLQLQAFLQSQGKPFNANPSIVGRPVSLYMIWMYVFSFGGSAKLNAADAWPALAAKLGFQNNAQAVQDLRQAFDMYLSGFERGALARRAAQQQASVNNKMAGSGQQGSPTQSMPSAYPHDGQQHQFMQMAQQQAQQMNMPNTMQQGGQPGSMQLQNGMQMPGAGTPTSQHMDPMQVKRPQLQGQGSQPAVPAADASPALSTKRGVKDAIKREASVASVTSAGPKPPDTEYKISARKNTQTHGGYDTSLQGTLFATTAEITLQAQESIRVQTLFRADIRALTMSLQSGIPSEVRYAIDSLVDLSSRHVHAIDPRNHTPYHPVIILDKCGDLLDAILDTFEDVLDVLDQGQTESSTSMKLLSYEDLLRIVQAEQETIQDVPEPGTLEFELEHAADRLIALLLLMLNVSMEQFNQPGLSSSTAVSLVCKLTRLVGTRKRFLRTHRNTLDFYKYLVTFLSNIAGPQFELSLREDAQSVLHFLLAFSPQPAPTSRTNETIDFTSYNPSVHRYLPPAVDAMAKILARQEPNRQHFRRIFTAASSGPGEALPADLFTRAFGMAISFLPKTARGLGFRDSEIMLLKKRRPFLSQGMLAADILASLVPSGSLSGASSSPGSIVDTTDSSSGSSSSANLARLWLESNSNWPSSLLHIVLILSSDEKANDNLRPPNQRPLVRDPRTNQPVLDDANDLPGLTAHRGLSMLFKLVEKAMAGSSSGRPRHKVAAPTAVAPSADADAASTNGVPNGMHESSSGAAEPGDNKPLTADEAQETAATTPVGAPEDETGAAADEGASDAESDAGSVILLRGDPLPKRETITALASSDRQVDTEALRLMEKLYDLIVPRS